MSLALPECPGLLRSPTTHPTPHVFSRLDAALAIGIVSAMIESRAPLSICEALAAEYRELRPNSNFDPSSEETLFAAVHSQQEPLSALCISGGGIRSATFALGAIQGLAEQGLLQSFDYLSTVSGGGYIGSWLTCWKQRAGGLDRILPFLRRKSPPIPSSQPDPIQHLREYNNYLSPKLGIFSADTWTLAATVSRNMCLNWLVFVPLLMAALMAPRLILSFARLGETFDDFYGALPPATAGFFSYGLPVAAAILFAIAIYNMARYLPAVGHRESSEFDFLKWVLAPLALSAFAFITYDSWFVGGDATPGKAINYQVPILSLVGGVVAAALAGWFAYLIACGKPARNRLCLLLYVTPPVAIAGAGGGAVAWLLARYIYPSSSWSVYTTVAAPLLLLSLLLAGCLFVGFSSHMLKDEDREWLSRAAAWVFLSVVGWTAICALVLLSPAWVMRFPLWLKSLLASAGGAGGWLSSLAGRSSSTSASVSKTASKSQPSLILRAAIALGAPAFVFAIAVALVIASDWLLVITGLGPKVDWWNHSAVLEGTRWESAFLLGLLFVALSTVMARFININKFSLHAMYRSRLVRAYLGASNDCRNADKFTGFAENDNLKMHDLDPTLKPFHVVNTCLNLVAGRRLAWQQRKAESFTITPLHCGSSDLGYRPSDRYGDEITLGTAVTISGAAANPNMGYHSSPVLGFIMTLFSARLGAWLGNPGKAGEKSWQQPGPTSAVGSLVAEAFGLTNNTNQWVNLSDGGHFENLGLYEMVRRRCRLIMVLDGSCDADFTYEDLGNALRKIRIDFKIPIDFEPGSFEALREKTARFAVARIGYDQVDRTKDEGRLIYVKPMIRGNESPDVLSYHANHSDFPHQSTADQFFDESQTESYRALGAHTIAEICQGWDGKGVQGLPQYLTLPKAAAAKA